MQWMLTLIGIAMLSGCASMAMYEKQRGEHCGANAECRAQQRKEQETAGAIESAIIIGATEAVVDAVSQKKEPTPQAVDPGYQCRNPDDVVICSALDGCYCAEK
ncbi:hypothetical protein [Simiduia agarivorans]|uniref:Lipoprotein n=1 Tax=Simiduia agarivorans (strain DSM 21679 / JCM 13881 / BCRC 17597 / SA1) TaxID=1117647 RepID=K4KJQ3_SIMAS|nr:hypothetical protein [Simiduia agarivorans]AFU98455.1 hypothetical protein M5M_06300 [Simiduia agarivorans SA1 = DSM 21679]